VRGGPSQFFFSLPQQHPQLFLIMLATTRKAIINTVSKATYATAATANAIQVSSASNGVKVASSQEPGQTASLAVVVNGGTRVESGKNVGVSHFLKNYGFRVKNEQK
jgi:ubiquinol-cytochrome c reductase core subunit 2